MASARYEAVPILNMVVPHSPHLPRVAGLPFFMVTCLESCISRLSRHLMQYPVTCFSPVLIRTRSEEP